MANNEQVSQDVKVEETQAVSAENQNAKTENNTINIVNNNVVVNVNTKKGKAKKEKAKNQKKAKDKKPNKIAKKLKETSSELKKVTWPKFTTVLKQTGVVLAVTAAFLLVVFGIDRLCSWLVGFIG